MSKKPARTKPLTRKSTWRPVKSMKAAAKSVANNTDVALDIAKSVESTDLIEARAMARLCKDCRFANLNPSVPIEETTCAHPSSLLREPPSFVTGASEPIEALKCKFARTMLRDGCDLEGRFWEVRLP